MLDLNTPVTSLPSTSAVTIKKLKSVGVNTFEDLINYFPSRYNDVSVVSKVGFLQEGEQVTIQGKVIATKQIYTRRHITIQEIIVEDETGKITVTWFNQPYILKTVKKDVLVSISGKVKKSKIGLAFEPLEFELLEKSPLIHTGRITPVYPEKRGLSSHTLRSKIHFVLQNISQEEYL
ncbi:MAG: OB-fold nucleic acid binding domain-containing protein, partial [Patescibacteria group bacterium]